MVLKQTKAPLLSLISGILAISALSTPALQGMDAPLTPKKTYVVNNPNIQPTRDTLPHLLIRLLHF